MELVILAAGNGKRFGGLKQFEEIDNQGNFLVDYTIYDAIKCGVKKIIFVIQKKNFSFLNKTIRKRWKEKVEIKAVFQEKQLGTCDALFQARRAVTDSFIVVNADDLYGKKCFKIAKKFLIDNSVQTEFAMVAFKTKKTLPKNKQVKRGLCEITKKHMLKNIQECVLEKNALSKIKATSVNSLDQVNVKNNQLVSVNFFIFKKNIFNLLKKYYFINNYDKKNNIEYFLPTAITTLIDKNLISVKVFKVNNKLRGMTYFEDKKKIVGELKTLKNLKVYPKILQK